MTIVSLYNIYYEALQGVEAMEKVKNSSPQKLSAYCWSTVDQQLADSRLPPFAKIFCQQSADSWPFVGRLLAASR